MLRTFAYAIEEEAGFISNHRWRSGYRNTRPHPSLHAFWPESPPRRCWRHPWVSSFWGRHSHLYLGILLHFLIACTAAAVYYGASRRLQFLTQHALVCGLFFGTAVDLTMSLIVLPLSALHATGPYQYLGVAARASCPYGSGRLADLFQCSSVRTIGVYPSFTMIVASD